jgi:hypothetical protein
MRQLIAYILQVLGVLGLVFYYCFEGSTLPTGEAWLVLSIFLLSTGASLQALLFLKRGSKK